MKKVLLSLILLSTACSHGPNIKELTDANVSVTNFTKTSGGSGSIIESTSTRSLILTNSHVCELVAEVGGLINTQDGKEHIISGTIKATNHDLCVIIVSENLHAKTIIAKSAPREFDKVMVIGHPNLFPTVITEGRFSKSVTVPVQTGSKPCSEEDFLGPNAIMCAFFGVLPQVRLFQAILVSALIMPGSSGSPVYNEQGELAGVAFAGAGNIGFGLIVPWEFVVNFLASIKAEDIKAPSNAL